MTETIEYAVSFRERHRHLIDVEVRIPAVDAQLVLAMPSWTPGSYLMREFPRNVQGFSAWDAAGGELGWRKLDKNSWAVETGSGVGPVVVRYRVYANELSVRTSHVDASHAYINGASVFMFVRGLEGEGARVAIDAPEGWLVATALPEEEAPGGAFLADDYDMLVDCPFEIGTHQTIEWGQRGLPHRYVIWGADAFDEERLLSDTRKVIEVCADLFGGLPYDQYLFILHVGPDARGGLEHKSSTSLLVTPAALRDDYDKLISLVAHEFFHVWLGKRIRPEPLGPFDYCTENYTRNLWVVEGFTTYYTELILLRAGLLTPERFLERIGRMIAQHETLPGRFHQSLEDSSFDSWIRFYRPDAQSPNAQVSYYAKGALVALVLDLELRRRSGGARSLDDVMLVLWKRYGARDIGFPEVRAAGIQAVLEEVAGGPIDFLDELVAGTGEIDFDRFLRAVGLELVEPAAAGSKSPVSGSAGAGAVASAGGPPAAYEIRWGLRLRENGGRVRVTYVLDGRAGAEAGVNSGDEVLTVDGRRASLGEMARIAADCGAEDVVELTLLRRDRLVTLQMAGGAPGRWRAMVRAQADAGPDAIALREGWLRGPQDEDAESGSG